MRLSLRSMTPARVEVTWRAATAAVRVEKCIVRIGTLEEAGDGDGEVLGCREESVESWEMERCDLHCDVWSWVLLLY